MSNPESLPGYAANTELPGAAQHDQLPGLGAAEPDLAPDVITTEVHSGSLSALMAANEVLVTNLEASLRDAITAADAAAQQNTLSSPAGFNPLQ
jgi:hypothetical protein